MIAWSYMEYEELVLKNVLLAQQKRRKNAVIINSTKQITILNKVKDCFDMYFHKAIIKVI